MRKRDRRELGRYARAMADELELRDWTINLLYRPSDRCNDAEIGCVYGQKTANLQVSENFRQLDRDRQRQTITHELLHCHWHLPSEMVVTKDLEAALGAQADQLFAEGFRRQLEYAIDATAAALAKHLPYIDWPK